MLKAIPFGETFCMVTTKMTIFIFQTCCVIYKTGEEKYYFLVMMTATSTASNELSWEGGWRVRKQREHECRE